jgi:hypothetical protein
MGGRKDGVEGWGYSCNCEPPFLQLTHAQKFWRQKKTYLAQEDDRSSRLVDPILVVVLKFLKGKLFPLEDTRRCKTLSAGIFKQSIGGWEPSRNRVVVPARQATQPGGIGSLESILGLLKSLKIRAQGTGIN